MEYTFTYDEYVKLINVLRNNLYTISTYEDNNTYKKVVLRHDVDFSLTRALDLAKLEAKHNIKSIYFILLTSNFYNVFSRESLNIINEIMDYGHNIGLHFDEVNYDIENFNELESYVEYERNILENALGISIKYVSFHRPSKWFIEGGYKFKHCINVYSKEFLDGFKYLSDSRMRWRENVFEVINSGKINNLHILTHPFWYSDEIEDIKDKLTIFINEAREERIYDINDNFTNLHEILGDLIKSEIKGMT